MRRGKVHGERLLLWSLLFFCYFSGISAYKRIGYENSFAIVLSSTYPDTGSAEAILEEEKNNEVPVDICFYWDGGFQTLSQKDYGKSEEVLVAGLAGNGAVYDWRAAGFDENDRDGCLLDDRTAWKLFGSAAPGGVVTLGTRQYTVRKVLPWPQKLLVIHPENPETRYTRVFVRKNTGRNGEKDALQFLMRNGLTGTVSSNEGIRVLALFSLLLLPGRIGVGFFGRMRREWQQSEKKEARSLHFLLLVVCAAAFAVFIRIFGLKIEFPGGWIPGRWSDFSFWQEKISMETERFRVSLLLPKTVFQTEQLLNGLKAMGWSLASFSLFCRECKKRW